MTRSFSRGGRAAQVGTTGTRVLAVSREVARKISRKVSPAMRRRGGAFDPEDLAQDAALAALEVTARSRLDPRQAVQGYMWRAASRETGLRASRMLAVVSISEGAAGRAREMAGRVEIDVSGRARPGGGDEDAPALRVGGLEAGPWAQPERALMALEGERAREAARRLVRRRLDHYLAHLPDDQRRGVEALLGRDGPEAEGPADAARRAGTTPEVVRKGYQRLVHMAAGDFELRRLSRKMEEEEEGR